MFCAVQIAYSRPSVKQGMRRDGQTRLHTVRSPFDRIWHTPINLCGESRRGKQDPELTEATRVDYVGWNTYDTLGVNRDADEWHLSRVV